MFENQWVHQTWWRLSHLYGQWVFNDHAGCWFWVDEARLVQRITSKWFYIQNRNMFDDWWQVFFPKICITMDRYWALTTSQKPIFIVFVATRDRVNRNSGISESQRPLKPNSPLKFLMKWILTKGMLSWNGSNHWKITSRLRWLFRVYIRQNVPR